MKKLSLFLAGACSLAVLIIGGLVGFGLAFNAQISLSHAAHEAARASAFGSSWTGPSPSAIVTTDLKVVPQLSGVSTTVSSCGNVTVTGSVNTVFLGTLHLSARGVEQCYG